MGIGSAWALVGCASAYVYFGGPLPKTDKVVLSYQQLTNSMWTKKGFTE